MNKKQKRTNLYPSKFHQPEFKKQNQGNKQFYFYKVKIKNQNKKIKFSKEHWSGRLKNKRQTQKKEMKLVKIKKMNNNKKKILHFDKLKITTT